MNSKAGQVASIAPGELKRRLDAGEAIVLLDVREDFERDLCKINRSENTIDLHIPMNEIPSRFDEIMEAAGTRPIAAYCHHGVRSMVVARFLAARGANTVLNLTGGIDAWSIEVDPTLPRY